MSRQIPALVFLLTATACRQAGFVAGPADAHCADVPAPAVGVCEAATTPVATAANAATYYGSAAQDDDCKYHLAWTVGDPSATAATSIQLTVTDSEGGPVIGAQPQVSTTRGSHTASQAAAVANETAPGVYLISPIRFDGTGRWTVRFDLFSQCSDVADSSGHVSPRAHAAFWLDVG